MNQEFGADPKRPHVITQLCALRQLERLAQRPKPVAIQHLEKLLHLGKVGDPLILRAKIDVLNNLYQICGTYKREQAHVSLFIEDLVVYLQHFEPSIRASGLRLLYMFISGINRGANSLMAEVPKFPNLYQPKGLEDFYFIREVSFGYLNDIHHTVRQEALSIIQKLYTRGISVTNNHLRAIFSLLNDDSPEVCLAAMDVVCAWSQESLTSNTLSRNRKPQKRGLNSIQGIGFMEICDLVNDPSHYLRKKAISLLGTFKSIPRRVLLQTLSKEVLPAPENRDVNLRQTKAENINRNKHTQNITQSEHVKNSEKKKKDGFSFESSSCGAFVHGSEDEFEDVRNCTLKSMNNLCNQSKEFAGESLNYIIDMLNDEMESVRLNAITNIWRHASRNTVIVDEKWSTLIVVLRDSDQDVRNAAYKLLGVIKIKIINLFLKLLEVLINNVIKYRTDMDSIHVCLAALGYSHAEIIDHKLIQKLFNLDPRYVPVEIRLEMDHICRLILIHYAIKKNPLIESQLPAYVVFQLPYIKAKYDSIWLPPHTKNKNPGIVYNYTKSNPTPALETFEDKTPHIPSSSMNTFSNLKSVWKDVEAFVAKGLFKAAISTFQICLMDTTKLLKNRCDSLGSLYFLHSYTMCCKLMLQIKEAVGSLHIGYLVQNAASKIMALSYTISLLDTGITPSIEHALLITRLFAMTAYFLVLMKHKPISKGDNYNEGERLPEYKYYLEQLRERVDKIRSIANSRDSSTRELFDKLCKIFESESKSRVGFTQILTRIINVGFCEVPFIIRRCMSTIEPFETPKSTGSFESASVVCPVGVPYPIEFRATIQNCINTSTIAVQVTGGNKKWLYWPTPEQFTRSDQITYKLKVQIPLYFEKLVMDEKFPVALNLVYCKQPEIPLDSTIIEALAGEGKDRNIDVFSTDGLIAVDISKNYKLQNDKYNQNFDTSDDSFSVSLFPTSLNKNT